MGSQHNPASIRLSAPIQVTGSGSSALPSRFTGIAYSGGLVRSYGVVIDLASTVVPPRMALLDTHSRSTDDIVGLIDSVAVSSEIRVAGSIFSDIPGSTAERLAKVSQRGVPLQLSVGVFGYAEDPVPEGRSAMVNGKMFPGPVTVLRRGTVREVSVCTLGADWNADVQLFSQPAGSTGAGTSSSPRTTVTATPEELNAQVVAALQRQVDAARAENQRLLLAIADGRAAREAAEVKFLSDTRGHYRFREEQRRRSLIERKRRF